jgi:ribose transport system permease protein
MSPATQPVDDVRPAVTPAPQAPTRPRDRLASVLSVKNIGAVYVGLVIIAFFSIYRPDTFATGTTVSQILNNSSITALAALALLIPLSTRTFDLSIGYVMTLAGVTAAYFQARTGVGLAASVVLALLAATFVGAINGLVVVVMRIDSFIGTLATGSLVAAFITLVTNEQDITDVKLAGSFGKIGQTDVGGVTLPVLYAFIVAVVLWYLLEHTATGRRAYAVGFNTDAARLVRVRVDRLRFASLLASSFIAGIAGVALASTLGSGSTSSGQAYLLPAFAAAFLGATQLRPGKFNAAGTLIAVLVLTTGTTGLALSSAPAWAADMFTGVMLITALALTGAQRRFLQGRRTPWDLIRARLGRSAEATPTSTT